MQMQKRIAAEILRRSNTKEGRQELTAIDPAMRFERKLGDPEIEKRVAALMAESEMDDREKKIKE